MAACRLPCEDKGSESRRLARGASRRDPERPPTEFFRQWTDDEVYGTRWHSIRSFFGLTSFGANANEADLGGCLVVAHRESDDEGHDELYFVARGRAGFVLDGEHVEVGELGLLCVGPDVMREAWALETPTILVMFGSPPGRAYRVPGWDGS